MNYKVAYAIGFHPWEHALENEKFVETITALIEGAEFRRNPPFGKALDVGTGSGIWGVELAKRGWEVTGIDYVEGALARARDRVEQAGVDMDLVNADVTALGGAGFDDDYRLILETGTFHGLKPSQRIAMGREIDAIAAPDATGLLFAWEPRRRGPFPRGATLEDIQRAFPGWSVSDLDPTSFQAPKPVEVLMTPNEHWYRLTRAG